MNKTLQTAKYVTADLLAGLLAWAVFFMFRKWEYEGHLSNIQEDILTDQKFYLGLLIIPLMWVVLYLVLGHYKQIYRKSRIRELGQVFMASILGVMVIFFGLIMNDEVENQNIDKTIYAAVLFGLHFSITALFRLILTTITVHKIHNRQIGFNTLIIGGNGRATELFLEMENEFVSSGNRFIGFLHVKENKQYMLAEHLQHFGHYKGAKQIIQEHHIEEAIIAIDPSEHKSVDDIITTLEHSGVTIKVIPDIHNILLGSVKMTAIFQAPLIQVSSAIMPLWQKLLKRTMDIAISVLAMIFLIPVYLFVAIGVRLSSPGPIFYSHERIGYKGKPFKMIKFRSMYQNAEKNGTSVVL